MVIKFLQTTKGLIITMVIVAIIIIIIAYNWNKNAKVISASTDSGTGKLSSVSSINNRIINPNAVQNLIIVGRNKCGTLNGSPCCSPRFNNTTNAVECSATA